ncbi:glycosyltransferase family 2 protein [Curtobacterium sp. RRHDQ10]|uniref:glycosyltransferase family 2 protein n=1 Tax=Curtobacterium phyllosphaerae TaxID=3413379 RepID=UPI003BF230C1
MTARPARVGIVTVSYNSGRYLTDFLASTTEASTAATPVIVADNRSEDPVSLRAATEASGATFLELGTNAGYGSATNRAVAALPDGVEWVLVSNPDVVLGDGAVDTMLATATASDDIGAVGPAIVEPDGSVYPSARRIPSLRNGLGHALFANVWASNPWTQAYHSDRDGSGTRDTGWLSGACLLVRLDAFRALGGFDERYFMYFEDVDLGYRLGRAGYRNVYEPAAQVMHVGAHSTRGESDTMRRAHHASAYRFLASKYSGWYLWPLRVALRVALGVRARMHGRTL